MRARRSPARVRVNEQIDPEPAWAEAYEDGYGRFRALYHRLRS